MELKNKPIDWEQPLSQGLLLVQNGGRRNPLAKAAKMAPKIR